MSAALAYNDRQNKIMGRLSQHAARAQVLVLPQAWHGEFAASKDGGDAELHVIRLSYASCAR